MQQCGVQTQATHLSEAATQQNRLSCRIPKIPQSQEWAKAPF